MLYPRAKYVNISSSASRLNCYAILAVAHLNYHNTLNITADVLNS